MISERLDKAIREVPNFPKEGINFKDITPLLMDAQLTNDIIDAFINQLNGIKLDAIVGIESRGFLFGFLLANTTPSIVSPYSIPFSVRKS